MPIEFRCATCRRLLRVGDDAAGRQVQCPECGTVAGIVAPGAGGAPAYGPEAAGPAGPQSQEAENPYSAPYAGSYVAPVVGIPGEVRPTLIDLNDVFSRTWAVFREQWGICLGVLFAAFVLNLIASTAAQVAFQLSRVFLHDSAAALAVLGIGRLLDMAFNTWLVIGVSLFLLKTARGQPAGLNDIFSGGTYFWRVVGGSCLYALIVLGGFVLFIVPGVIFSLMFSQFFYLILDRNLGVFDSLSLSKQLTSGNKLTMLVISVAAFMLGCLLVLLTCGLGAIGVIPFFALLRPVMYLAMTGQPTAGQMPR